MMNLPESELEDLIGMPYLRTAIDPFGGCGVG
jgi:hypothetical protein